MKNWCRALLVALSLAPVTCAAQSAAEEADAQVIENLRQAGSDLAKAHSIEFFFYFPSEENARSAAKDLTDLNYSVKEVRKDPDSGSWTVLATRMMVPCLEDVVASTVELEKLAGKYEGDYDGWGTEVVK